ncbi:MAG: polysaccharide deacetylase family protein [Oscillospiraceae bacterium]|nr:polysaccharide deacetylase family protein [Oscillospiraceae bacterium]
MKKFTYTLFLLLLIAITTTACSGVTPRGNETQARRFRAPTPFNEVHGHSEVVPETDVIDGADNENTDSGVSYTTPRIYTFTEPPEPATTFAESPGEIITPGMPEPLGRGIDATRPMIALTFDDGPSVYTGRIAELLEEHGGRGTFFVLGNRVANNRGLIENLYGNGHEFLGHSWRHSNMIELSNENIRREILDTHAAIENVIGTVPRIFRPPFGKFNQRVQDIAAENGFAIVGWEIDTFDWRSRCSDKTYSVIMSEVSDRTIILMHDIHTATAQAMETVIPRLVEKGYQLVTVSELMHYTGRTLQAGGFYSRGNR